MPLKQSQNAIQLGQRYRQVKGGRGVWFVAGFTADHTGNQHARLILEKDRTRIATIAVAALNDPGFYQRVSEEDGKSGEVISKAG